MTDPKHTNTDPLDELVETWLPIYESEPQYAKEAVADARKELKQAINNYINSRMLELRPNIDGINPNAKEYYAGFKQAQIEFDQRIAELNQVKGADSE